MNDIKKLLCIFLGWRIILFAPLILGNFFIPIRQGYPYAFFSYYVSKNSILANYLISSWANFDGVYYILIASFGYTSIGGFFPLFPFIINIISSFFLRNITSIEPLLYYTALVLSSTYFFLTLYVFFKLICLDYSKKIAWKSIFFLLLFPTSFFFVSIYTESLFSLLSLCSFYFARKRKWFTSSIFAFLLGMTRFVGIAIIPALIIEFLLQKQSIKKSWPLILTPLGLIAYGLYCLRKWNDFFYFIHAQGNFLNNRSVNTVILPIQTLYRYLKIMFTVSLYQFEFWISFLELSSFFFVCVLLLISFKKKIRLSYLVFSVVAFSIPVLSGTFSGLPRYILPLSPFFICLSLIKSRWIMFTYFIINFILLFILLAFFSRGYYIS